MTICESTTIDTDYLKLVLFIFSFGSKSEKGKWKQFYEIHTEI